MVRLLLISTLLFTGCCKSSKDKENEAMTNANTYCKCVESEVVVYTYDNNNWNVVCKDGSHMERTPFKTKVGCKR